MGKVSATFDWKAERPLAKEKEESLKLWRFVGGGMVVVGSGLIYLANHQYYHLTGDEVDILRTYNLTWWTGRGVTGAGVVVFGRNYLWLDKSFRKSYGAYPFFDSLQGKSYKEIKAEVEADAWGFLGKEDIWALLKPSFDKLGCTKFWKKEPEAAKAFKETIKTLVKMAAAEPTQLEEFFAEHGLLPIQKGWISDEDKKRFAKEARAVVEKEGALKLEDQGLLHLMTDNELADCFEKEALKNPTDFTDRHGFGNVWYVRKETAAYKAIEKASVVANIKTIKYEHLPDEVKEAFRWGEATWTELRRKHRGDAVKTWKDYRRLREEDGGEEAYTIMLKMEGGKEIIKEWFCNVGYCVFATTHEWEQLKGEFDLKEYIRERSMLDAWSFFQNHGWSQPVRQVLDNTTLKRMQGDVKTHINVAGLKKESGFYKLLPDQELKEAVDAFYDGKKLTPPIVLKMEALGVYGAEELREKAKTLFSKRTLLQLCEKAPKLFDNVLLPDDYKEKLKNELTKSPSISVKRTFPEFNRNDLSPRRQKMRELVQKAGITLKEVLDQRWKAEGFATHVEKDNEFFWAAYDKSSIDWRERARNELVTPSCRVSEIADKYPNLIIKGILKPEDVKDHLQKELENCKVAELRTTYGILVEHKFIQPSWPVVQRTALCYCIDYFDSALFDRKNKDTAFLYTYELLPEAAQSALAVYTKCKKRLEKTCSDAIEESETENQKLEDKYKAELKKADEIYESWKSSRKERANELAAEIQDLNRQCKELQNGGHGKSLASGDSNYPAMFRLEKETSDLEKEKEDRKEYFAIQKKIARLEEACKTHGQPEGNYTVKGVKAANKRKAEKEQVKELNELKEQLAQLPKPKANFKKRWDEAHKSGVVIQLQQEVDKKVIETKLSFIKEQIKQKMLKADEFNKKTQQLTESQLIKWVKEKSQYQDKIAQLPDILKESKAEAERQKTEGIAKYAKACKDTLQGELNNI